jgi:hypothetical protein
MHPTIQKLVQELENEESEIDLGIEEYKWQANNNQIEIEIEVEEKYDYAKPLAKGFVMMMVMGFLNFISIDRILPGFAFTIVAAVCVLSLMYFFGKGTLFAFKQIIIDGGKEKDHGTMWLTIYVEENNLRFKYSSGKDHWFKLIQHVKKLHSEMSKAA